MNCKAIDGLIRYLTRVIPDGLLLSIAHVRFTWFNKCKRFAGLNFKCKLEVGLIILNCQLFSGRDILTTLVTAMIYGLLIGTIRLELINTNFDIYGFWDLAVINFIAGLVAWETFYNVDKLVTKRRLTAK